jgi:succinate dehydrogenase/fumarate reductase-like Fe-S protein
VVCGSDVALVATTKDLACMDLLAACKLWVLDIEPGEGLI